MSLPMELQCQDGITIALPHKDDPDRELAQAVLLAWARHIATLPDVIDIIDAPPDGDA